MSPNRKESLGGLELLSGSESARPSNGNGINHKNGHAASTKGKAKQAGHFHLKLRDELNSDDPFPLGLETAPSESKMRLAFPPASASINDYRDLDKLLLPENAHFQVQEQVQSPDHVFQNGYAKIADVFHQKAASQPLPLPRAWRGTPLRWGYATWSVGGHTLMSLLELGFAVRVVVARS